MLKNRTGFILRKIAQRALGEPGTVVECMSNFGCSDEFKIGHSYIVSGRSSLNLIEIKNNKLPISPNKFRKAQ